MGRAYTDKHRVILYQTGKAGRDITDFCSDIEQRDELNALACELSFGTMQNPHDGYVPNLDIRAGDKVRVENNGTEVFSGIIIEVGLDGTVTAYDPGWYLNTSQIVFQCAGLAADEAIRRLCGKAGVAPGSICALPTKMAQVWVGATPADILADILGACTREIGKEYQCRVDAGKLTVQALATTAIKAFHKPADNLSAFDITWALGQVSGSDSIAELRNAVVLAAEDDSAVYIGAQAANAASIQKYGLLQLVETADFGTANAALAAQAKNLLALNDRVAYGRQIDEIWGADEVRSGVVLDFNSPAFGISGRNRVTAVTHRYGKAGHTMSLELSAIDEPRAADASDKVQVWGVPDEAAGSSGGGTGDAGAFLAAARGEVGTTETPPGSNRTKYGKWAGNDGVAWCVIFVCWCAAQSGAPIPTGLAYVGDMTAHFSGKGKYKTVASGYIPQPGDLMIQSDRHIGIVESATRSAVQTIEGNCSNGVRRMTRYYGEISGFCTPFA